MQYEHVVLDTADYGYIVVASFIFMFVLALGIGANDTANSWGTSFGSKSVTLRQAFVLASLMEAAGAFALGSHVSGTVARIVGPETYCADPYSRVLRMMGMASALLSAAFWLWLASFAGLPLSNTHAIVGANVGFGVMTRGVAAVDWSIVAKVVASWVVSPLLGAGLGFAAQAALQRAVFADPRAAPGRALKALPLLMGLTLASAVIFALFIGGKRSALKHVAGYWYLVLFAVLAVVFGGLCRWGLVPRLAPKLADVPDKEEDRIPMDALECKELKECRAEQDRPASEPCAPAADEDPLRESSPELQAAQALFRPLTMIVAATESFAHGANDIGNAIGPFTSVLRFADGRACAGGGAAPPPWALAVGALAIVLGLWGYGYKVMEVIGTKVTRVSPSRAYAAELAAVLSIMLATSLGMPVSTTHASVGAITGMGLVQGVHTVNWRTITRVLVCVVVTAPAAALLCAAIFGLWHGLVFGPSYPPAAAWGAWNASNFTGNSSVAL